MDGAMENLYRKIAAIGRRFRAERVVLFGSRARGDNRSRSDIDIAVFGASQMTCLHFVSSWTNCRPSWNLIWFL